MRILIQRVKKAKVDVENKTVGEINSGLLVFLGIKKEDDLESAIYLKHKLVNLRIFSDENDKMNLSIKDVKGEILVVSQFTLYGDCSKGRRPSFDETEDPILAKKLYEEFIDLLKKDIPVKTGIFGAKMEVFLINDGPLTFLIESK